MGKLNQVIAVVKGKKAFAKKQEEAAYHLFQKGDVFNGLERRYSPKNEEGETLPPESKKVQFKVDNLLGAVTDALVDMLDAVVTQDVANTQAKASVVVGGKTLLQDVPVTSLLVLEKQLADLQTFVSKIPTLDLGETWRKDEASDLYVSEPTETHRSIQVSEAIVLYPATEKHPAQTQLINRNDVVGFWKATKFSGAWSAEQKNSVLDRVRLVKEAIVLAREEANSIEVTDFTESKQLVNYIFGA